jgi:hypothetical protein
MSLGGPSKTIVVEPIRRPREAPRPAAPPPPEPAREPQPQPA